MPFGLAWSGLAWPVREGPPPEQIRHRLVKDFPDDKGMRMSAETTHYAKYT